MNVFLAGGSGAIGVPLVRLLVAGGHQVTALTRSSANATMLRGLGATAAVADALDPDALHRVVVAAHPTHVIHQLTALPKAGPRRATDLMPTNRLRIDGTRNLIAAAVAAGAARIVGGSFALMGAASTQPIPADVRDAADAVRSMESQILEASRSGAIEGVVLRYGLFYLSVAVTVPEAAPFEPQGVIGVDLGIVNVATDSEGNVHTGEPVKRVRRKYRRLRQLLQRKKTRSARKHLVKARRRESRFVKNENHRISKALVQLALDRRKALGIENLAGIRGRGNDYNRAMRTELNAWAFNQLILFIRYKSKRAGVTVIQVDPRYSSQPARPSAIYRICRNSGRYE